jgi:hypothetical protein
MGEGAGGRGKKSFTEVHREPQRVAGILKKRFLLGNLLRNSVKISMNTSIFRLLPDRQTGLQLYVHNLHPCQSGLPL